MSAAHEEEWALDGQVEEVIDQNQATDPAAEANEAPQLTELEQLAAEVGWKPEADWKGPKDGWTDAATYLRTTALKQREASERSREAQRHLRASQRSYDELQARMERLTNTTTQLAREQEARHRAEIERYFEAEKRKAAKGDNDELYDQLDDQKQEALRALDEKFRPEPEINYTQQAQEMLADPVLGKFLREHPFVVQDEDIYAYVFSMAEDLANAGYPKSMQIQAVKQALRDDYPQYFQGKQPQQRQPQQRPAPVEDEPNPWDVEDVAVEREPAARDPQTGQFVAQKDAHLFQQQQRRPAPQVASGSRMPASSRAMSPEAKAWNDLPAEAREVFKQQKASGSFKGDIVRFAKIYKGEVGNVLD